MRKDIQIQDKIQQGKNARGIDPYMNSVRQKKMVDCKHCCGVSGGSSFKAHLLEISKQVQEKRHFTGELKQLSVDKVEPHKCSYCRKQGLKLEFKVCSDCR